MDGGKEIIRILYWEEKSHRPMFKLTRVNNISVACKDLHAIRDNCMWRMYIISVIISPSKYHVTELSWIQFTDFAVAPNHKFLAKKKPLWKFFCSVF